MDNIKLRIVTLEPNADEHICIAALKHCLELKHEEAKFIVNAAKRKQVQIIELPMDVNRHIIVSNLNFLGLKTSCI